MQFGNYLETILHGGLAWLKNIFNTILTIMVYGLSNKFMDSELSLISFVDI